MEKGNVKNYGMCITVFVIGMLSVLIAGLLGGYYCFGAAVIAVVGTIFAYKCFDNNSVSENMVDLICMGVILLLQIVFFFVNDVLNIAVYDKNNLNFMGVLVMASQVYSGIMIGYYLIRIMFDFVKKENIVFKREDNEDRNIDIVETKVDVNDSENKVELKAIGERSVFKEAPFMEEEK